MKPFLFLIMILMTIEVWAIDCDCEVLTYAPITGSHQLRPNSLKYYELNNYSSYSKVNIQECRNSCLEKFHEDLPEDRLNALLQIYAQTLINEQVLGYNCTGLTTLKFPVRVKATFGSKGLGNLVDTVQVINHEESCF